MTTKREFARLSYSGEWAFVVNGLLNCVIKGMLFPFVFESW